MSTETGSVTVARETRPFPVESSSVPSEPYTDIIYLSLGDSTSGSGQLTAYLSEFLDGCGQVNLLSLSVNYQFATETDYIRVGTAAVASSATVVQLATKKNGVLHVSNAFVKGLSHIKDIIPMSNVSRRLQPPSANEPMLKLVFEKSQTCVATFIFHLEVVGIRERHSVFVGATGSSSSSASASASATAGSSGASSSSTRGKA